MNLFQSGEFKLHSGDISNFRIDCDALTDDDWQTLAVIGATLVKPAKNVWGVPTGGFKFRDAFKDLWENLPLSYNDLNLIVDDVYTSGGSMEEMRQSLTQHYHIDTIVGLVAFSRGKCPAWITPIFQLTKSPSSDILKA